MTRTHPLIARARLQGAPLIDGKTATFIWEGKTAPLLLGDFTDWQGGDPLILTRQAPDVWTHTLTLPQDAYIEYAYFSDVIDDQRLVDPFNPRTLDNGYGKLNHYFYMSQGAPTELAVERDGIPRGKLTRHSIETDQMASGKRRTVHLYRPPCKEPVPLLVVFDGSDYLNRAHLAVIVDNLIAEGRIHPLAMAFINHGGHARFVEYSCSEATLDLVLHKVLPLAKDRLNLIDIQLNPGVYGVLGASMGGLIALYAGLRLPHIFGRVLSQSGSFTTWERDMVVYDLVRYAKEPKPVVWMDVGRYEWLLETNRGMHSLLVEKGIQVTYQEYNAGHNYPAWRDDVWSGLECLYGIRTGSE